MDESVRITDPTLVGAEMILGSVRFFVSVEFGGLRRSDTTKTQ
jgi:hypothetical protein